eukprot:258763-Chlamydomonas_euryale.AAC.4
MLVGWWPPSAAVQLWVGVARQEQDRASRAADAADTAYKRQRAAQGSLNSERALRLGVGDARD